MVSVTIYPDDVQHHNLQFVSRKTKIAMSTLIRHGIDLLLEDKKDGTRGVTRRP